LKKKQNVTKRKKQKNSETKKNQVALSWPETNRIETIKFEKRHVTKRKKNVFQTLYIFLKILRLNDGDWTFDNIKKYF
jgi:hypothetical protein